MIWGQVSATADDDLARATWDNTLEEIEKQWVWRDVSSDVDNVILAKRFGLQQKNKVRVIDDCSVGGYNTGPMGERRSCVCMLSTSLQLI